MKQKLVACLALACLAPLAAESEGIAFPSVAKTCVTCHGRDGIGTSPGYPNLAGQKSVYAMLQLTAFRSGKRQSEVMNIIAKDLTDEDIRTIAEYYEAQPACGQ